MSLLDLFGVGKKRKAIEEMILKGAVIVDVRTKGEYERGHVPGSINVPLDTVKHKTGRLKKLNKPLILCCASGMRSGTAMNVLKSAGIDCMNGGGWRSLM